MKDHPPTAENIPTFQSFSSHAELYSMGKKLREKCPLKSHAIWRRVHDRADPLRLLEESNKGRIPELIPIRYGRMMQSPFTFYRGTALNMAADLATTPVSGPHVQACGDCHLCNFGGFATPERRVIVDINDLDETLPAPWEWDVKRLAASFVLASRHNSHSESDAREAAQACVRSYRNAMADFSQMRVLDIWYSSIDLDLLLASVKDKETRKRAQRRLAKARQRCVLEHDFPELATTTGTGPVIKDNPPLIYHPSEQSRDEFYASVQKAFAAYRKTLPEHRRQLLDHYKFRDIAVKVVGVGSVGTACAVILAMAGENDPLFLQVKQARASVLEPYAGKSVYTNHGQRVVVGCKLVQSASDLFLGWTQGHLGRHYYIRQLKDMKIKLLVELFSPQVMRHYAEVCGRILARSHARGGQPSLLSGYMGKSDKFDQAIASFSMAYADQSERDHKTLTQAVRAGKVEVIIEEA
ncbi:MAG: DUF2252 domain-containing protein [Verrucomicrobiota bacterium]